MLQYKLMQSTNTIAVYDHSLPNTIEMDTPILFLNLDDGTVLSGHVGLEDEYWQGLLTRIELDSIKTNGFTSRLSPDGFVQDGSVTSLFGNPGSSEN